jgi:hypothetical protein
MNCDGLECRVCLLGVTNKDRQGFVRLSVIPEGSVDSSYQRNPKQRAWCTLSANACSRGKEGATCSFSRDVSSGLHIEVDFVDVSFCGHVLALPDELITDVGTPKIVSGVMPCRVGASDVFKGFVGSTSLQPFDEPGVRVRRFCMQMEVDDTASVSTRA